MPIQNIPVMLMLWGVVAFGISMIWADHKDEKHAQGIARVRRCEVHRRAVAAMEYGKRNRAERMNRYHGLV